ncbi:proline dehydrogenase [Streptomyces sp. NBC_01565]|uniref:proline dehydrogenase n=1 Tax=Streptomyces sp. NBC_01565 TaxID=2975881 RepID=UPI00225698D3|nr:proline dehydrogenase [Streptomyces sp. NBC_01565]MCX4539250.1 proline dehydrogenase [Streptomyces sp. NBC_01565]
MDSGLAALLGAAVGSATTLGAAIVNGRAQARSQHAQWSRQHRRDAYAGYLSALHNRDIARDAVLDALRSDRPDLPDIDEKTGRFITLAREVHRACEIVILEGPAPLAEVAERVTVASSDLSDVMRRMAENAHAGNTTHKAEDIALAAERERILYEAVKDFRLAARSTIGKTN